MIRIIKATEYPATRGPGDIGSPATLVAEIEIDGLELGVGGLDPSLTQQQLMDELNSRYDELLIYAQTHPSESAYIDKPELVQWTSDSLPKSAHYAQLVSVDISKALPVEVRRWFEPAQEWFDGIWCLVSELAVEQYQAGKLKPYDSAYGWNAPQNEDTFVSIEYHPNPANPSEEIPCVMGKVRKTW